MKKTYIEPEMAVMVWSMKHQLLAGSGPGAGDQSNPGMVPELDSPMPMTPEELLDIPANPLGL